MSDKKVLIKEITSVTGKGISFRLNGKASLNGGLSAKEWYVSWDKIGKALFDDQYSDATSAKDLREERAELKGGDMNTESAKRPPDTNYELLDKIKKQSMEIARLNAINVVCSLEKRELIEVLAQSARLLDCLDEKMAADKCRAVIKRVAG